ncbi:MAG: GWxTD domain-containing protein [Gemmatimonadaceae bacterium]|nr:GWxTD domain-containing protein [Gemmatimonadaceae bacterium]
MEAILVVSFCRFLAVLLASASAAWSLHAQPAPSASPRDRAAVADTARAALRRDALERVTHLLRAADTAGAVDALKRAAAASPDDARLWHDYGMLLSVWNKPYWRTMSMPAGIPQRLIAADSALARAMWLAPDSATYALHYGEHLFNSNQWNFANAMRVQSKAVERAEASADTLTLAQSRDALGLFYWRRYETVANRRFYIMSLQHTPTTLLMRAALNRDLFDQATRAYDPPLGEALYREAATNFRRARELDMEDGVAFRHDAMLLAERARWDEMAAMAGARSKTRPAQTWPWFALGIAEHRRGRAGAAHAALDSAYARLSPPERERLSSLSRLLPPGRKTFFDTLNTAGKQQLTKAYFDLANPTLLVEGNLVWDEFRARVAFAELMWTNEQLNVRGVDSDRGEAMVRWGPPDNVWSTSPDANGLLTLSWLYRSTGFLIAFTMPPTYGTAFVSQNERSNTLEPEEQLRPARWDNLPLFGRGIDSLPVQVARFRHGTDSLDIAVFAGVRAGALRAGLPTDTSVLTTGVFAVDALGVVQRRITDVVRTGERDTLALTAHAWRTTVPASVSYLRVEALETDALRLARVIRDVTGFPTAGFGISDLLIGTGITAPANEDAARWSDYRLAPITGNALRVGRPVDLLWEVYAPTAREGNVQYRVSISVQRVERAGLTGVVARLGGRVRNAVVRSVGTDKVAVQYDRTAAVRAQRTESIRLDLGSARAGRYLMTLEVTDLNSGATAITHRDVVLVDR